MIRKIFLVYSVFTLNACESPIQDNYTISTSQGEIMIENFSEKSLLNWNIVNDTVMGGRSQARMRIYNNMAEFKGYLSLANNGGFSSVRAYYPNDLIDISSVVLRVKGDGRKYQFRIQSKVSRWANYSNEFKTKKDLVQTFYLPFKDFKPSWRGRRLNNLPTLKGEDVVGIGFLLGDKVQGKFKLEIIEVGATSKKSYTKRSTIKKTQFDPMTY